MHWSSDIRLAFHGLICFKLFQNTKTASDEERDTIFPAQCGESEENIEAILREKLADIETGKGVTKFQCIIFYQ